MHSGSESENSIDGTQAKSIIDIGDVEDRCVYVVCMCTVFVRLFSTHFIYIHVCYPNGAR